MAHAASLPRAGKIIYWLFSREKAEKPVQRTADGPLDARTRRAIMDLPPYLLRDIGVTDL